MADTTFPVLDAAGATTTFRAQNITTIGTTLVMMSVPSDASGTALLGQKTMATSLSVVVASDQSPVKVAGAGGTTLISGTAIVDLAYVGGTAISLGQKVAATSIPVVIASNQSVVSVAGAGGTMSLGGGTTLISGTTVVDVAYWGGTALVLGQKIMATSLPVAIASNQSNVPVNLAAVGGTTFSLGQKVMATSVSVVIASDQSPISVVGGGTTVVNLAYIGGTAVTMGQAVMATSLPVAIASNQSELPVSINSTQIGALGQATMASSVPVAIASNQSTVPMNVASWGGTATSLGAKVMATSVPVVIASDQAILTTRLAGGTAVLAGGTTALGGGTTALAGGTTTVFITGYTALPASVANNTVSQWTGDKWGRGLIQGSARELRGSQVGSTNTAAEITIVNAINASTIADLYGLILSNTGATATRVDVRYDTGAAVVMHFQVATGQVGGFLLPTMDAVPGSTVANKAWTLQCAASTVMYFTALYVKNGT